MTEQVEQQVKRKVRECPCCNGTRQGNYHESGCVRCNNRGVLAIREDGELEALDWYEEYEEI